MDAELRFAIRIDDMTTTGEPVPFGDIRPGDLDDLEALQDRLSRLLGLPVTIETAEE